MARGAIAIERLKHRLIRAEEAASPIVARGAIAIERLKLGEFTSGERDLAIVWQEGLSRLSD